MIDLIEAPAGCWESRISSEMVVEGSTRLNHLSLCGGELFFEEMNPSKKGEVMLVALVEKRQEDLLTSPFSARTRINEYGGKSYCVAEDLVFFCNQKDQCIYWVDSERKIHRLTEKENVRYGDLLFDQERNRLLCVQEEMEGKCRHLIVGIDLRTKEKKVLAQGRDFYASLALSFDGSQLAYLCWDHPFMPWDAARLVLCPVDSGGFLGKGEEIAGKKGSSAFQPRWSSSGTLFFVSEITGFWNLYCYDGKKIQPLLPLEAEFGVPQWALGLSTYAVIPGEQGEQILCSYIKEGIGHLAVVDIETGKWRQLQTPFTYFGSLVADANHAYFIAASPVHFPSIVQMDVAKETFTILKQSKKLDLEALEISHPQEIRFKTAENESAYGFYYAPKNSTQKLLKEEKPPLIVLAHGGPTSQVFPLLNLGIQFWTNRGFAVVDVNYRGSTGYGRSFREKLFGHMLYSAEDCIAAAHYLVKKGLADGKRLIIKGGSAGGYMVLAACAYFDAFQAGVCYYGVSDLEALAKETHKFESHYGDQLVGPYPEEKKLYEQLSPINFTDRISAPILFFQGTDDKIVPPGQSQMMFESLKKRGIPTALILFEQEGHGFCQAANIKRCLDAEEAFYSQIFGFSLSKKVDPLQIENISRDN